MRVQIRPATSQRTSGRGAGIILEALGGDPAWIAGPEVAIERWLRPVVATGLFDGVHLDVEPHAHPAWDGDRASVVAGYLELLQRMRSSAGSVHLDADVGHWFHTVAPGSSTLDREAMRHVDAVTILADRNRAEGDDGTIATELAAVARSFRAWTPWFHGVSIHDAAGYVALPP